MLSSKLQTFIEQQCKGKTHIKLTVGVLHGDEQFIQTFGANGEVPDESYVYEIGSITKTFTASLLAKYISEGKMSLDDSIAKYIDGLDNGYYPTIERLATHTAGYGYLPATIWDGIRMLLLAPLFGSRGGGVCPDNLKIDEERMVKLLLENKKEDKDYPWAYSNFGIGLLGIAIGKISGCGYRDTMNEFLANDLEMPNSYTGIRSDKNLRAYNKKNKNIGNWDFSDTMIAPAGDISSTAADMLLYARKQMNEELPYLGSTHHKYATINKQVDCGLAWLLWKDDNQIIAHNGGTGGFDSLLMISKRNKRAYVVLSNYLINQNKLLPLVLEEIKKDEV